MGANPFVVQCGLHRLQNAKQQETSTHTHTLLHIRQVAAKTQHKCAWILDEAPCKKLMEFVCVCVCLVIKPQGLNIYQHVTDRQDPQKYCGYHETIQKSNKSRTPCKRLETLLDVTF